MREFVVMMSGWAAHYLVHSAVVLIALGAAAWWGDRLLRRVGPEAQHRMWVAALLAGVALPLVPAGWLSGMEHSGGDAGGGTVTVTYRMVAAAAERWTIPSWVGAAVSAGYLLTLLFCLVRVAWRWRRTDAMVRRSTRLDLNAKAARLLEDAAMRAGVAAPELRCSPETHGPVVLGWRRSLLIVPEEFFDADEEDIAAALAHECTHIARRDFAKNLLYEFAAVAVAYHPACWMIRRRIAETREMICDEQAAGMGGDRPEYAASLVRLARAMASPSARTSHAIGVFDGNTLEERIMRLTTDLPGVSRGRKFAMAAITTGVLLGGALSAVAVPFDLMPQGAAAAQEKVYEVGGAVSAPRLTYSVDAEFPDAERKAGKKGLQGVTVLKLIVDSKGMPRDIRVKRSLRPDFDRCAIRAVRQYKFDPAMRQGKPVAVAISIEVNFRRY